jgi:hypothetical protein
MAPSTPKKSHHKKKQHRSDVVADLRTKKRQDTKASPKRPPPHPIVAVTQDINYHDPSDDSTLTPSVTSPPLVPTSTPNATIKTLIRREGYIGSTKPVTITATNILAWFRENAEAPLSGTSETLYRGARNLFQPFQYKAHTSDNFTTKNISSSSICTSPSIEAQLQNHIHVSSISPIRRLLLEDICLLPSNTGLVCVFCVGNGHSSYDYYHELMGTLLENERLPTFLLNGVTFVQFKVTIINNPHWRGLETGNVVSRNLFNHLVVGNGNASIGVEFMGTQHGTHTAFLLFKDFFMCHSTFQLWACLPYRRNFREAFKSKSSKDSRLHLLRRLSLELHGDVAQTLDLCSAFDAIAPKQSPARRKSEALATALASPIDTMKSLPMSFYNENIKQFSEYTNQLIAERVQECYGSFISWTTSILPDDTFN